MTLGHVWEREGQTGFSWPTRLIACATQWQWLHAHQMKAVWDKVKHPQTVMLRKENTHVMTTAFKVDADKEKSSPSPHW